MSGPDLRQAAETASVDEIFASAAERARKLGLGYAGAVTPAEAWRLQNAGAARIVDVRTAPEWEYVGHVPAADLVEWRKHGEQRTNPEFLRQLEELADRDEAVLFLCRSGVRSHYAAEVAARAGYTRAFNILEGFEGDLDPQRHRGTLGGWRRAGLPWVQG